MRTCNKNKLIGLLRLLAVVPLFFAFGAKAADDIEAPGWLTGFFTKHVANLEETFRDNLDFLPESCEFKVLENSLDSEAGVAGAFWKSVMKPRHFKGIAPCLLRNVILANLDPKAKIQITALGTNINDHRPVKLNVRWRPAYWGPWRSAMNLYSAIAQHPENIPLTDDYFIGTLELDFPDEHDTTTIMGGFVPLLIEGYDLQRQERPHLRSIKISFLRSADHPRETIEANVDFYLSGQDEAAYKMHLFSNIDFFKIHAPFYIRSERGLPTGTRWGGLTESLVIEDQKAVTP